MADQVGHDGEVIGDEGWPIRSAMTGMTWTDRHCRLDRQSQVFGMTVKFFDILERKDL